MSDHHAIGGESAATFTTTKTKRFKVKHPRRKVFRPNRRSPLLSVLMWGVKHSIRELQDIATPVMLMPDDFRSFSKIKIDNHGFNKDQLPSHFKVKEYCPLVFRNLRQRFGINEQSYMRSMSAKSPRPMDAAGRSGSKFYMTRDKLFVIKTLLSEEVELMHSLLKQYHPYIVQRHGKTLLPQYLAMYRITVDNVETYLVVIRNVFSSDMRIHSRYDLKGSTVDRDASQKERNKRHPVFKDNDFLSHGQKLHIGPDGYKRLMEVLTADVQFLVRLHVMDYSLLLGVHVCKSDPPPCDGPQVSGDELALRRDQLTSDDFTTSNDEENDEQNESSDMAIEGGAGASSSCGGGGGSGSGQPVSTTTAMGTTDESGDDNRCRPLTPPASPTMRKHVHHQALISPALIGPSSLTRSALIDGHRGSGIRSQDCGVTGNTGGPTDDLSETTTLTLMDRTSNDFDSVAGMAGLTLGAHGQAQLNASGECGGNFPDLCHRETIFGWPINVGPTVEKVAKDDSMAKDEMQISRPSRHRCWSSSYPIVDGERDIYALPSLSFVSQNDSDNQAQQDNTAANPSSISSSSPLREIYFVGLVDILTQYGMKKQAAKVAKTVKYGASVDGISTVQPEQYAARFLDFISKAVAA